MAKPSWNRRDRFAKLWLFAAVVLPIAFGLWDIALVTSVSGLRRTVEMRVAVTGRLTAAQDRLRRIKDAATQNSSGDARVQLWAQDRPAIIDNLSAVASLALDDDVTASTIDLQAMVVRIDGTISSGGNENLSDF